MVVGGRELIDTLWNVNVKRQFIGQQAVPRINRYIMECKFKSAIIRYSFAIELIDTLWNVNLHTQLRRDWSMLELIDTLWNVNLADNIWVRKLKCELIDTLWNVNKEYLQKIRYIAEN